MITFNDFEIESLLAEYASIGVDMIVTSSPYSAQPADIKVRIEPL
jgi:molybdenum transport protein